jgi:hypothetical protein
MVIQKNGKSLEKSKKRLQEISVRVIMIGSSLKASILYLKAK